MRKHSGPFFFEFCSFAAAAPARSPTRPPIEDTLKWVAGWGSGPVPHIGSHLPKIAMKFSVAAPVAALRFL